MKQFASAAVEGECLVRAAASVAVCFVNVLQSCRSHSSDADSMSKAIGIDLGAASSRVAISES